MDSNEIEEFIKRHGGKSVEEVCIYCANSLREKLKKRNIIFVEIEDVVHDAMIKLIPRITVGSLKLSCSFSTYLYGSCEFVISEICKLKEKMDESEKDFALQLHHEKYLEMLIEEEERILLMKEALAIKHRLGKRFEKMLRLTAKGVTGKKLRSKMGFKSAKEEKEFEMKCKTNVFLHTKKCFNPQDLYFEILRLYT